MTPEKWKQVWKKISSGCGPDNLYIQPGWKIFVWPRNFPPHIEILVRFAPLFSEEPYKDIMIETIADIANTLDLHCYTEKEDDMALTYSYILKPKDYDDYWNTHFGT